MKYCIKTFDKFWIGYNGEFVTKNRKERKIFDTKKLAQWYVDGTNVFGELKLVKNKK